MSAVQGHFLKWLPSDLKIDVNKAEKRMLVEVDLPDAESLMYQPIGGLVGIHGHSEYAHF